MELFVGTALAEMPGLGDGGNPYAADTACGADPFAEYREFFISSHGDRADIADDRISGLVKAGCANPQCGHTLFCSAR